MSTDYQNTVITTPSAPHVDSKSNQETSKSQILKAAEKLFAQKGYKATTLKDLATQSGSNTALVSYYFGSKEGLRKAVLQRKVESVRSILDPLVENKDSLTIDDFRAVIQAILRHVQEEENFHRLAIRAFVEDEDGAQEMATLLWQPLFDNMFSMFRKTTKDQLPAIEIETRCMAFCGLIQQYANLKFFYLPKLKTSQSAESMLKNYETLFTKKILTLLCTNLEESHA